MLLFIACTSDSRDLHSFPTRRSSDLVEVGVEEHPEHAAAEPVIAGGEGDVLGFALTLDVQRHLRSRWGRDRKSTRLNSSHVAISYAVFCLKKKNNTYIYTYRSSIF